MSISENLPPGSPAPEPVHHGFMSRVRNYFLTGLIVAGPVAITIWLIWSFVTWVDDLVRPFIPIAYRPETYLPVKVPGFGLIIAFLALTGAWVKAAILVGWGLLVISSIDNFLSPRLVGQRARLHELLIFFGVLGGVNVFGVIGVVLGPVLVAVTLALLEMVRQANQPVPEDETLLDRQEQIRQVS